jgi:hypothetical protein
MLPRLTAARRSPLAARPRFAEPATDDEITAMLDALEPFHVAGRHHVHVRGHRTRIDHLLVAPSGVYVVDTRTWPARAELRTRGGVLRSKERLYTGTRDRTRAVDALGKKVVAVRHALGAHMVPVHGVLCLLGSDWPLLARAIEIHGVTVVWPKELERRAKQLGKLDAAAIATVAAHLFASVRPR